jgi:hypothetical protein
MKPQELTMLALRVVAVYIASSSFVYLAQAGMFLAFPPAEGASMPTAAIAAFWLVGPLVIAIIIWSCAPYLGRLAARGVVNDQVTSINSQALVGATFAAAGTLIFVTALPSLVSNVMRAFEPHSMFTLPMLVGTILQCVLGFGLVVGSGAASRFVLWLRYAGTGVPDL